MGKNISVFQNLNMKINIHFISILLAKIQSHAYTYLKGRLGNIVLLCTQDKNEIHFHYQFIVSTNLSMKNLLFLKINIQHKNVN